MDDNTQIFPTHVYNHDILLINDKIDRTIEEILKSVSSGISGLSGVDTSRLISYLDDMSRVVDFIQKSKPLDLPATHPRAYPLESPPEIVNSENEAANYIVRLLWALKIELLHSQSARMATRLIETADGMSIDYVRFITIIEKARAFVLEYVNVSTPLDLPESSPREPMPTHGRMGV